MHYTLSNVILSDANWAASLASSSLWVEINLYLGEEGAMDKFSRLEYERFFLAKG